MNKKYQMEQEYKKYLKAYNHAVDRGVLVKPLIPEDVFNRVYKKALNQVKIIKKSQGDVKKDMNFATLAPEVRKSLVNYVSQDQGQHLANTVREAFNNLSPDEMKLLYQEDRELAEFIANSSDVDLIKRFRSESRYASDSILDRFHEFHKRTLGRIMDYDSGGEDNGINFPNDFNF